MDMMNSIASASMGALSARTEQQYGISMMKKVMNTQEQAAEELLDMLPQQPQQPQIPKGRFLDVYA